MIKQIFLYTILLLSIFSCREGTQVNVINGTLFQDCSTRIPNAEIALKANIGANFGEPIILGTSITNDQGAFNLTYNLDEDDEGTADLLLINSVGFETLISSIKLNINQDLVLFRVNESNLLVNLDGTKVYGVLDTLFYGISYTSLESFKVQPSVGLIDTLNFLVPNYTAGSNLETTFYYGIGNADFELSKEAVEISDSSYQNIPLIIYGCSAIDSVTMVIN